MYGPDTLFHGKANVQWPGMRLKHTSKQSELDTVHTAVTQFLSDKHMALITSLSMAVRQPF